MKQKLLLILMLATFCPSLFAQGIRNSREAIVVWEMNSILSTSETGQLARSASTSASTIDVQRLRNLVTEVQPSEYFYSSEVKSYGNAPSNLFTDAASLSQISRSGINKQNIEIVTIRINTAGELSSAIDLSVFSNFPNLKYIYILSNVETTKSVIIGLIQNNDQRFSLFYKIDKGA